MRPRILIARPDHLGDVLLTVPAAVALRSAVPGAHISFLVTTALGDVVRRCPDVDQTYTLPFPRLASPPDPAAWSEVVRRNVGMLRGRFDLVVLSRPDDPWSGELAVAAEIPVRVGYATPGMESFLTVALPFHEEGHVVIQTLKLIEAAAGLFGAKVVADDRAAAGSFAPTPADEAVAEEVLLEAPASGPRPVVFQPGSGWPLKNWGPRRWGGLAKEIRRRWGLTPLVPGGPGEDALVAAVVEASEGAAHGLAGRLSVGALAALYRRASIVIGIDSGPIHLAVMVGAPVVGLYGPLDPLKWGPWCPPDRRRVIRVELPCSPCDCIFDPPCGIPIEPACCTGITVDAVLAAAEDLINSRKSGHVVI
ncbi:MAG TPA: glycosyltransferase family 9 protein [Blastocatellia bacterium]|nr:glycosyltransferase family 9 protein [Blastocatellia bacterium]